jgi:hypothetical protein
MGARAYYCAKTCTLLAPARVSAASALPPGGIRGAVEALPSPTNNSLLNRPRGSGQETATCGWLSLISSRLKEG